jgi:hypothetical protein
VFGLGENLGALAGLCAGCNIGFGLPCSVRLTRAQPHTARVRSWPWANLTIARTLTIEEVTEEQGRAGQKSVYELTWKRGCSTVVNAMATLRQQSWRGASLGVSHYSHHRFPVPSKVTCWCKLGALSLTLRDARRFPRALGLKVNLTVQFSPARRVFLQ